MLSVKNITKEYMEKIFKKTKDIVKYKNYYLKERKT